MNWLWAVVALLVVFGSLLAVAETSISRMSRVRAIALREEGRRNAALLEQIEADPARYLNSIYLAVMLAQNGSAILVAVLAQRSFGNLGITLISVGFTLLYFVVVEAMSKTFGILHSDQAALALAPLVWFLGRVLAYPTRALIGLANILLPGKGLKAGPFVSEEDIRSMAEVASEEEAIEEREKEMIHSIFEFGDTVVRDVMVPRPDVIAIDASRSFNDVLDRVILHGYSRIPVYRENLDEVVGVVYAKDVLRQLHAGRHDGKLQDIARKPFFVPESKKVSELLRDMQNEKFHLAIVVDEFGSVSGLVTLEDLLEEIVGEIVDEYDREEPNVEPAGENRFRVNARLPVDELNELLDLELPNSEWDTVGGLMMGALGRLPQQGEQVEFEKLRFTAERVHGRRIAKVLIERVIGEAGEASA
ncbi:MAG TPA: hemolysin family protein [Actinomycetota bacterium]|jgi:CBS domain containing-hemolysin-like protein|nr:hemolysin family protein [Actinomycetota bacterium]